MDNDKVHRQGFPGDQVGYEVFRSEDVSQDFFTLSALTRCKQLALGVV